MVRQYIHAVVSCYYNNLKQTTNKRLLRETDRNLPVNVCINATKANPLVGFN